ncbi:MAG: GNAT family N-acetyltransferase [Alphaproteobacteria bacterium]|nr:GNAT family N-acetyltransferase [Alphaproteobacteria bacterium]
MTIREVCLPDDEPAILSFLHGLQDYEADFEPDRRRDPDWAVEHWREVQHRCAERHGVMLIAEEAAGGKVGWAFAHDERAELFVVEAERHHGFLAELYVVPEARGKGYGRALIRACEAWAKSRGHKLLTVGVLAGNEMAVRAYDAAGYRPYTLFMRRYL